MVIEHKSSTWRELLFQYRKSLSVQERKIFDSKLSGTSRTSFYRWTNGEMTPDAAHFTIILEALPEGIREQFIKLLRKDEQAWNKIPTDLQAGKGTLSFAEQQYTLDSFFLWLLQAQQEAVDRFYEIGKSLLLDFIKRIDVTLQESVKASIVFFDAPTDRSIVTQLRAFSIINDPRDSSPHLESETSGALSLAGHIITQRMNFRIQNFQRTMPHLTIQERQHFQSDFLGSAAGSPIINTLGIAGAFVVYSSLEDVFSSDRLSLIDIYAHLARLAFYDSSFYEGTFVQLETHTLTQNND